MSFDKPFPGASPSNRNYRNETMVLQDTEVEEIETFVNKELLFLDSDNKQEKNKYELIIHYAHPHGTAGFIELTAINTAWRLVAAFALDHESFIEQNVHIKQQNDVKLTFDTWREQVIQQACLHPLADSGQIDPYVIAAYTSDDERLRRIKHSDLQRKLRGIASQYVFFKRSRTESNNPFKIAKTEKNLTRCEPNLQHMMAEFTNITKNRSIYNAVKDSDIKFLMKNRWEIDLTTTGTLVDSNSSLHLGLVADSITRNIMESRPQYDSLYNEEDTQGDLENSEHSSNNELADDISRNM